MYTPVSQFYYIKVGCKGVNITRTCLHDVNVCCDIISNTFLQVLSSRVPVRQLSHLHVPEYLRKLEKISGNHWKVKSKQCPG